MREYVSAAENARRYSANGGWGRVNNGRGPGAEGSDSVCIPAYNAGMRIRFERTGGFSGRRLQLSLDSSSLPQPKARQLRALLSRSRFFELPVRMLAKSTEPDRFHYRITVEEEDRSHTVEAAEAAVPVEMRPLLDWLTRFEQAP